MAENRLLELTTEVIDLQTEKKNFNKETNNKIKKLQDEIKQEVLLQHENEAKAGA